MLDSELASVLLFLRAVINRCDLASSVTEAALASWTVQTKTLCKGAASKLWEQQVTDFVSNTFIVQESNSDCHPECLWQRF